MKKIGIYLLGFTALSVAFMMICVMFRYLDFDTANYATAVSSISERKVIVIDPGHGGEDGGCVSPGGILEKDLNLIISKKIRCILAASGNDVIMTREDDTMLYDMYGDLEDYKGKKKLFDLKNRIRFARENNADAFISIHMNKFPQPKYSGLQVYYSANNEGSELMAEEIKQNNTAYLQKENKREIKAAGSNIYVLDRLEIPAVLVECGFLSNPDETALLCDDAYREKLALMIATSIMSYNES